MKRKTFLWVVSVVLVLGTAAASGMLVLYYFGLSATIYLAAALNVAVSAAVWLGLKIRDV